MIALPPLLTGAVNVTTNEPVAVVVEPEVAFTAVGAPGTVAATNAFEGAESGPVPTPLVALTVQVYVLPAVSVVTETGLAAPLPVRSVPPFDDVQVAV